MTADDLRLQLLTFLSEDLDLNVVIQGKRLVVRDGIHTTIILCTAAKVDDVAERTHAPS